MHHISRFIGIGILALTAECFFSVLAAEPLTDAQPSDSLFRVGEELEYRVSYSFFTLGSIRIRIVDASERNGRVVYRAQAFIDSAPGLPFVDLHVLFESEFDEEVYSYTWVSADSTKQQLSFLSYTFNYDSNWVVVEKSKQKFGGSREVEEIDTVKVPGKAQDGLSLFFYARKNLFRQGQVNVPTVIGNEAVTTTIAFLNKRESVEIDAREDKPIDVLEIQGKANYSGVFGMTGAFSGWFSNDSARVPIVARMRVLIGSIYIELVKWNRPGWEPPLAQE
ncbi:MAG: DUF3108 domain-containing protein [Ignavibacteriae bacterium]|nr:DUF3108 domain-containing protein [Ignavibacteriota bacterium]